MWKLADELLSKLGECCELKRRTDFSDIETIRGLDGGEVGSFRAFGGGKIEKVAIARLSLGPTAEYHYIRVIPPPRYRTPQFVYEGMTIGRSTSFSVDLYPAVDLSVHPNYFGRYHHLLDPVYARACEADGFSWRPSRIAWVRAIASPYFFMSTTEDQAAAHDLASAYLTAWLEFQASEEPVGPDLEASIRRRRDSVVDGLLAWDRDGERLVQVMGKPLFTRVFDAMLRA